MSRRMRLLAGIAVLLAGGSSALAQESQPKRPTRIRISQGVAQRNIVVQPQPKYPRKAIEKRLEGLVVFKVVISKDGTLKEVEVKSGEPILAEAAEKAVRKWRYKPYFLNGEPVEVETQVTIKFNLKGREPEP
ncbi:MAG: energy transducer TonB [Terriglobales bacterium]